MENKNSMHRNLEKIKINKTIQGCRYACTYVCLHIHTYAYKYIYFTDYNFSQLHEFRICIYDASFMA